MRNVKLLTDRQLDLMEILWNRGHATVREAKEAVGKELAYTSVLTVFQTLEKNGHVTHKQEGKRYRYFPRTERKEAARHYAAFLDGHGLLDDVVDVATEGVPGE